MCACPIEGGARSTAFVNAWTHPWDRARLQKLLRNPDSQQCIIPSDPQTLVHLLQTCGHLEALDEGRLVHGLLTALGFDEDLFIANYLITMYGNCHSSLQDALYSFHNIHPRNVVTWTSMITAFTRQDQSMDAVSLFHRMQSDGVLPNTVTFASLLTACTGIEAIVVGRVAHAFVVECGFQSDIIVNNALISLYDKCGYVTDAWGIFMSMPSRDVVTWTAMIVANTQHGHSTEALQVFDEMLHSDVKPNVVTLVNVISACASIPTPKEGMIIHSLIIECDFEQQNVVANALLILYGNSGYVQDAIHTFHHIAHPTASNWTTMIAVFTQHGHFDNSLRLFEGMQEKGVEVNKITLITVLSACSCPAGLERGESLHTCIVCSGYESDLTVSNVLISMYNKCGSLSHAKATFYRMITRDVVSWTSMIVAFLQHECCDKAIELFQSLVKEKMNPDVISFISILSACMDSRALGLGQIIHAKVLDYGLEAHAVLGNALLTMYGRCGSVEHARDVFDRIQDKSTASWNAMISFHLQAGDIYQAIGLFQQMQVNGVEVDRITFVSLLPACTSSSLLTLGRLIHNLSFEHMMELDMTVENALISMYGRCRSLMDAKAVFDRTSQSDLVAWTSMIGAYAQVGDSDAVVTLFYQMILKGVKPDRFTVSLVVAACSSMDMLSDGEKVHVMLMQQGMITDIVLDNALINMYGKGGSIVKARQVFDAMLERDLVSYNSMIAAHAQLLHRNEAFEVFQQMQLEGMQPDNVSYLGVLSACSGLADFNVGKMIHALVGTGALEEDEALANASINMYSKCGRVDLACVTFESLHKRGIVSWTTMIASFAQHGHTKEALRVFELMECAGIEPNEVSFVGVLSACSHTGLMDQALHFFKRMDKAKIGELHYGCMVDLWTRTACLPEAELFLHHWPNQPGVVDWMALLSASRISDDVERGSRAAQHVLELNQHCTAAFVVLGNAYVSSQWQDTDISYGESW